MHKQQQTERYLLFSIPVSFSPTLALLLYATPGLCNFAFLSLYASPSLSSILNVTLAFKFIDQARQKCLRLIEIHLRAWGSELAGAAAPALLMSECGLYLLTGKAGLKCITTLETSHSNLSHAEGI